MSEINDTIDVGSISRDYEVEKSTRLLEGGWKRFIAIVCIMSSVYHLYSGGYKLLPAMLHRPIHLGIILFLVFILYPPNKKSSTKRLPFYDVFLAIIALASSWYLAFEYETIAMRGGMASTRDLIIGGIFCIILFEAGRRAMGWTLPILSAVFVAYLFVGPYLPGLLKHGGYSLSRVIDHMYMYTEGIFGIALGVSSTYVYLFVLFGAFLSKSGTTELFTNLALALAGHTPGGPAKVGVIASGLMGTIQGSSAANVAATGMFTIPLMKKVGFKPEFAAAVEAVASCGGQFLPPIMGASAFIMAEYLAMPYAYVAAGALLPALIYYAAVYMQLHLRAVKEGLMGIEKSKLPNVMSVLKTRGHMIIPLIVLIAMLIMQFTPLFAAFFSIAIVVFVSQFRKETRMGIRDILKALEEGAVNSISTSIACAVVGFIVGSVALSGVGMIITHSLVKIGENSLLLTLIVAALSSLFLSMGLPTTSVYIITATVVAPSLVSLGVAPLVAHLFCYYWGGVSAITPPVALAVYVGAGIAGADMMKSGWAAVRLGIAAYITPFMFVYRPMLVTRAGVGVGTLIYSFAFAVLTVFTMAMIAEKFFIKTISWLNFLLLIGALVLLIYPDSGMITDILGVGIIGLVVFYQWFSTRNKNNDNSKITQKA